MGMTQTKNNAEKMNEFYEMTCPANVVSVGIMHDEFKGGFDVNVMTHSSEGYKNTTWLRSQTAEEAVSAKRFVQDKFKI